MNDLQRNAIAMGIKLENAIGTPEHRAKWVAKIVASGLPQATASRVYADALESRRMFGTFGEAVRAFAGCADGIASSPLPKSDASHKWNR